MPDYREQRKEELQQALAQQWIKRGQASRDIQDADEQIGRISHRLDEIGRAELTEQEEKKKAKKPDQPPAEPPEG